jgi:hypothetical protein
MSALGAGAGLFLLGFVAHVIWWRWRRPLRTGQALIGLLVAVIVLGWAAAIGASAGSDAAASLLPDDLVGWLQTLELALALAAAYAMTYPAIEVESPIMVIIEAIARRGRRGITPEELYHHLDESVLVVPRLQDLLNEGLVVLDNGRYRPTAKGAGMIRIFMGWRRILGADIGG